MATEDVQAQLQDWQDKEDTLEQMIPLIGHLYRKHRVITSVYGRSIINQSVVNLMKSHRFVRQVEGSEIHPSESLEILKWLDSYNLGPCHIDIGKLVVGFRHTPGVALDTYLRQQLGEVINGFDPHLDFPRRDVVLYGFGRIGRFLARILIEKNGSSPLNLRAIVVRKGRADNDLEKRASLLRRDSVHGSFNGTISVDEKRNAILANGNYIQLIYADDPADVNYSSYGIEDALLIDNTGVWRDRENLSRHLDSSGISRVLLTAPGKGDLPNVVFGVNHQQITEEDRVISAASCTTNAITPVLRVLSSRYGIESGHVETVHSFTNDQNLIDNYHRGERRGRSAPVNMVLTETGAAEAVAKALPELKGRLTGNAIRVPVPNVSMAILNLTLNCETTREDLNEFLRNRSLYSDLYRQIDFVNSPEVVSSDFTGNRKAGIIDAKSTIVNGNRAIVYIWYDNEAGYSAQVIRLAQMLSGIRVPVLPAPE